MSEIQQRGLGQRCKFESHRHTNNIQSYNLLLHNKSTYKLAPLIIFFSSFRDEETMTCRAIQLDGTHTHRKLCARIKFQRPLFLKIQVLPLHSSIFASSLNWLLFLQLPTSLQHPSPLGQFPLSVQTLPSLALVKVEHSSSHLSSRKDQKRKKKKKNGQGTTEIREIMRS